MTPHTPFHRPVDPLAELLHRADAVSPPPSLPGDLAANVRVEFRRRRHRQRVAGAATAAFVIVASLFAVVRLSSREARRQIAQAPPPPAASQRSVAHVGVTDPKLLAVELSRARAEAYAHLSLSHRMLAAERRKANLVRLADAAVVAAPMRAERITMLRHEAAMTLVGQAEGLKTRAHSPLDALATYRRAMELFPETAAAAVARQRLSELETQIKNQEIPS